MHIIISPDQTEQVDLGIRCPHMPEDMFSHGAAHLGYPKLYMYIYESRCVAIYDRIRECY